jgi:hypothetical protein
MKSVYVGVVLLLCSVSLHAQKTRFGQDLPFAKPGVSYPLTVHVYGVHVRGECAGNDCVSVVYADVSAKGRKLEFRCGGLDVPEKLFKGTGPLPLGDVHARILKNTFGVELGDEYEVVVAGNRVLECAVSGMVE